MSALCNSKCKWKVYQYEHTGAFWARRLVPFVTFYFCLPSIVHRQVKYAVRKCWNFFEASHLLLRPTPFNAKWILIEKHAQRAVIYVTIDKLEWTRASERWGFETRVQLFRLNFDKFWVAWLWEFRHKIAPTARIECSTSWLLIKCTPASQAKLLADPRPVAIAPNDPSFHNSFVTKRHKF